MSTRLLVVLAMAACNYEPPPTPTDPPPLTETEFIVAFNDQMCSDADQVCGADPAVLTEVCAGVVDDCYRYNSAWADDCLDAAWTCGAGGVPLPSSACDQACEPPPPPPTPTETGTDPPPPVPAFDWSIALWDGDGVADTLDANGIPNYDADTLTVMMANSADNYPDVVEWEFGIAQTGAGFGGGGWFGEDCDGQIDSIGNMDVCHIMQPDTTMVLTRAQSINDVVAGSTTLVAVDYPESETPAMTYVLFGYDSTDTIVACLAYGDDPTYYPNCDVYTPPE